MILHPELRLLAIAGPPVLDERAIVSACLAAQRGGVTAVQLRWKNATPRELVQVAGDLVAALSIPVFVNDRADVAWCAGAFGVHLGSDDLPIDVVRARSQHSHCFGISVGDEAEARSASGATADYWSVGPLYATETKRDAGAALGPEGFARLAALAPIGTPVVAIGGIGVENAQAVLGAGAHGLAVSRGVFGFGNIEQRARELRAVVDRAA